MKYILIQSYKSRELVDKINEKLALGFKPRGELIITVDGDVLFYTQAMIKEVNYDLPR